MSSLNANYDLLTRFDAKEMQQSHHTSKKWWTQFEWLLENFQTVVNPPNQQNKNYILIWNQIGFESYFWEMSTISIGTGEKSFEDYSKCVRFQNEKNSFIYNHPLAVTWVNFFLCPGGKL